MLLFDVRTQRQFMTVNRATVLAFATIVVLGGLNAFAVKASNVELAPFWGAALRFGAAALVLAVIAAWRRPALPRGRALAGSVLYGLFSFAAFYALLYNALLSVPAGLAMVLLALAPMLTLLLAAGSGLELLGLRTLGGAVVAVVGVAIVVGDRVGAGVPIGPALAVIGGAATVAASSVIIKGFPKVDPVANNLVAMTVGAICLVVASLALREPWTLPTLTATWLGLAYVVFLGSVAMFVLYVFVVDRWTASAAAYSVLMMPLVTVPVAALLAGEAVSAAFLVGAVIVLAGVYVGAVAGGRTLRPAPIPQPADGGATVSTPGCP
jgi:drug/metabolite transporter (DMT)-like permease